MVGDITKKVPASLFGLPIVFTGKTPVLGSTGDLMLIDFSYYLIKEGSGPYIASSEHVYFTTNRTVVKCFTMIDGQPWVKTPLTLEDGSTTVSPYVVLV
jgi:HK97 family phage major capsid protein